MTMRAIEIWQCGDCSDRRFYFVETTGYSQDQIECACATGRSPTARTPLRPRCGGSPRS